MEIRTRCWACRAKDHPSGPTVQHPRRPSPKGRLRGLQVFQSALEGTAGVFDLRHNT